MKSILKSSRLLLILFVPLSLLTSSCTVIAAEIMGIRHIKPVTPAMHKRLLKKLGGNPLQSFVVDTNYILRLSLKDTTKRFQIKNHYHLLNLTIYFYHLSKSSNFIIIIFHLIEFLFPFWNLFSS